MKYYTIIILLFLFACNQTPPLSEAEKYFTAILSKEKENSNFEEDSNFGYIKIGNFIDSNVKHTLIIRTDSTNSLSIYKLENNEWIKTFYQENLEIMQVYGFEVFIEDFNFDGEKDLAIRNIISNGMAIMSFHLWLKENNFFRYVEDFKHIGNPVLLPKQEIVQGFSACCNANWMELTNYKWSNNKLTPIGDLTINDEPYEQTITYENKENGSESKIDLSDSEIENLIEKYLTQWQLIDTSKVCFYCNN
ncbi:MAG: hypothetical protein LRY27_04265 [Chitinophagales bacterium]|nr:hypothetical protein [Chitinophagales bacterium]